MATVEINPSDGLTVQITVPEPNTINLTQPVNSVIEVTTLGPQGPQGPQGEPGDGFPFDGGIAQVTGSLQVTGSSTITGSLNVSQGITGSLQGTASWAQNSVTASYALNASGVDTSSLVTTSSFNSFTSSIQSFTQSIQSSVNSLTNATSSYLLRSETGSLTQLSTFNNFTSSYTTGSFTGSFTGSLLGTASKVIIGDLGINVYPIAIASPSGDILKVDAFTLNNNSKFLNLPNDYTLLMQGTSTVSAGTFSGNLSGNVTGNLTGTASFATSASRALNSNSASFATTASYVLNAISASYIQNAQSASYVLNAISSSFTTTASYALNGGVTQIVAGTNITISPVGGTGIVTINSTGGGGGGFNTATGSYGSFYDTTTQTNPVASIPRSMSFNSTDISNGVSISGSTSPFNTYIKVANAGVYDIQFSAQLDKTDSGTDNVIIWIRKNGIDLAETATDVALQGNNEKAVAAWNWFVNAAAGDYFQLMWFSPDTSVRLYSQTATVDHPGIPSIIVTVNRVDQFLSNTGSFSGSFTGNLIGTASTASFYQETDPVFVAKSASLATTGSNNFNGNQTITGSLIQGLEGNIATGEYSHAEGQQT